jgi:hypothetical protein
MTEALGVLLLPLVLAGGALAAAGWVRHRRLRRLQEWAASVGWTYLGGDRSLVRRWRGRPFDIGDSKRVSELVAGTFAGRPALSFRFECTTGTGKNRSTLTYHVVTTALPTWLPTLELMPENVATRLARALGFPDIELESEEFNRVWRVGAGDHRFAHAVLHPRLMERLLRPDARGMSWRIEGSDILSWSTGAPRTEAIAPRLQVLAAVVDAVPRFVWLDHGHDPVA